jgi:uncharacterized membrane protein YphA (DoxX/SURF4 family)
VRWKLQHALQNSRAILRRHRDVTGGGRHVERGARDAREVCVGPRQGCHLGIQQDGRKPVLQNASIAEDVLEVGFERRDVEQRFATFNELTFSALLFLGLATRLATLPFLGMIAVIQTFVYPNAWVEHLVWTSILLFLLTRGGGAVSLDYLIGRRIGRSGRNLAQPSRTHL